MTVAAIVLAAGASTRMGTIKPLLPLGAHSLLQRVLQTLTDASVHTRILALGPPHGETIAATMPQSLPIAWNPDPQRGMLSSLQLALALLPPEAEGTLVWPADIPLVSAATLATLLTQDRAQLLIPTYQARGGHPLWLPRRLIAATLALPATASLRDLRATHAAVRVPVPDPEILRDLDTAKDYEAIAQSVDPRLSV